MFKKLVFLCFAILPWLAHSQDLAHTVNPFVGTGGHGHTFPGAVLPFGMVQVSPDTRANDSWDGCSGYHYSDSLIYGFSHTHLSGTGCSDWGDILLTPMSTKKTSDPKLYRSAFKHNSEIAYAGYYKVELGDEKIVCELTSTPRVGIHKYTFAKGSPAHVYIDLLHRDRTLECHIKQIDKNTFVGYRVSRAWAKNQYIYFALRISKPVKEVNFAKKNQFITQSLDSLEGAMLVFDNDGTPIQLHVAISGTSEDGALRNLNAETPNFNFDSYLKKAVDTWNKQLNKIEVIGTDPNQKKIFYTALYHTCIHPSLNMDVDFQYRGRDNQVHRDSSFTNYQVFSLWDTYRATHPLFAIIEQKRSVDFIKTFLHQYKEGGRLPVWELSGNETDCMIGFHSVSVITDAWVKGIRGFDIKDAYQAARAASDYSAYGQPFFNRKLYLAADDESESVSKTLEYAYDNWCVARLALFAGDSANVKRFLMRADGWKNLLNPETGFMTPRVNGNWLKNFVPGEINNHFTEGNSWQYSFYVPHNITGFMKIHGGPQKLEQKLDALFTTSEKMSGREQADVTGIIGQYAHGNEPSHHIAWMYNYVGQKEKSTSRIRSICKDFYTNSPDGLIGNEDCGQMSAWYVFASLGFYPVCPGSNEYAVTAPLFDKIVIHTDNGKSVTLTKTNPIYKKAFVTHEQLFGTIDAGPAPQLSGYGVVPAPLIIAPSRSYKDSMRIVLKSIDPNAPELLFSNAGAQLRPYKGPVLVRTSMPLTAACMGPDGTPGCRNETRFFKRFTDYTATLVNAPNRQYAAEGGNSLTDGIMGSTDWRKGDWIGIQQQPLIAIIDCKETRKIEGVVVNCLQDTRSWIVYPSKIEILISDDGVNFKPVGAIVNTKSAKEYETTVNGYDIILPADTKARYIKVIAHQFGTLPEWHIGAGGESFVFIDEIMIH